MEILNKILLYTILLQFHACILSSDIFLQDLGNFLNPDENIHLYLKSAHSLNTDSPYSCHQRNGDKTKEISQAADFDTGAKSCGYEMRKIAVTCKDGKIANFKFKLRNVILKEKPDATIANKDSNTHVLDIPEGQFIQKITIGYKFYLFKEYVTSLSFKLNNDKEVKLRCDYPWKKQEILLDNLERPTGVFGYKTGPYLTDINFHTHYLVIEDLKLKSLANEQTGYYTLLQNYEGATWQSDKFKEIGPFGRTQGKMFEDPIFYGHWKINEIIIRHDNGVIKNINTVLLNTLFHYVKKSGGHGSNEHNPSYQIERIKIDPKIEIIGGIPLG